MNTLHVVSTEEGTGKTAIAIALARLASERGATVGYMKPKGTRLRSAVGKTRDEDPLLAKELLDLEAEIHDLEPVVYSPTFVQEAIRGREDPEALAQRVQESFDHLTEGVDLMVVEGGGRLWTGGIVDLTDADLAETLDTRVVLVDRYDEVADVDEILAAADGLDDHLAGVLFNVVDDHDLDPLTEDVIPFLGGRDIETLGTLPREPDLAGVSVADLAETLGADVLTADVDADVLLERFSVGAMGSNSALEVFRRVRNAAVITGGDRSDVQSAALEASGVNCLVLTGGYRPSSAIVGKAEDRGVPVLLVQSDTRTTVDRTEEIIHAGRTRSAETVDRMESLLADGADVDALLGLDSDD